jgi:D-alanyl-D-alanine carboxypeptidase
MQSRAGELWYPASLTKLMTAYIVFDRLKVGKLKLDQQLLVSELASAQPPSKTWLRTGTSITTDLALQAMLVYSANDMAYVLAEAAAGSVEAFVAEMNATARRLGMTGTHFANPNGWFDPRQVSTARDLAILASAIIGTFPERGHYFSKLEVKIGDRTLQTRNTLLRQMKAADGMKTGYVCDSGFNTVATATLSGRRLGVVIFGAPSTKHRADLAEMLLVDSIAKPHPGNLAKLSDLKNMDLGTVVPADLTPVQCPNKQAVVVTSSRNLKGWGVSLGTYDTSVKADMALRGRLLSSAGIDLNGKYGVIRMPRGAGFAAVIWDLDESASRKSCEGYQRQRVFCEVLTPELFQTIAALTPDPPPKPRQKPKRP